MQFEVLLLDAGLAAAFLGLVVLLRPLPRLRLSPRRRGVSLIAAGLAVAVSAAHLPVRAPRIEGPAMVLDSIVPEYQFGEAHEIVVHASREAVWRAVNEVRAEEIRLFRTLTWLRSPHTGGAPPGILNPPAARPILETALQSGFVKLAEDPGREVVFGSIVCCGPRNRVTSAEEYLALDAPDLARAVMNFHLADEGGALRLRTQTRVHASSPLASRRFAAYWRVIYPGSAQLRRMWLEASRRRAEKER